MACISVSIARSGSGGSEIIYFNATDGTRNLYGDRAWGWGGNPQYTDAEYLAVVKPYILDWFGNGAILCSDVPPPPPPPPPPGGQDTTLIILLLVGIAIAYFMLKGK